MQPFVLEPKEIVNCFVAKKFKPLSLIFGLTTNCHWQTIYNAKFMPLARSFNTISDRIDTPDGDFFDIEYTENIDSTDRLVILLHGLESSKKGYLVTKMTTAFMLKGFACCLVSFRSCSEEENKTMKFYHLGFTEDIDVLTTVVHKKYPNKYIYLSGFSLGGNVVLKFLGEQSDRIHERGIMGAVTACVPFDPVASSPKLDVGFNRAVYAEVIIFNYSMH
jgi:hypothetical protein